MIFWRARRRWTTRAPPLRVAYGFCTAPLSNDSVFIADMFGGGLFDQMPMPTKPMLNSPANVTAITWYSSLWSEHALVPRVMDDPFQLFGQVSGTLCGFWMQYLDMFGFAETCHARVLPLPSPSDGKGTTLRPCRRVLYHPVANPGGLEVDQSWSTRVRR
jgi:hypothetical protein